MRVHSPTFASNTLLNAVFLPPCSSRTETVNVVLAPVIAERDSVPTRWLAFQVAFTLGLADALLGPLAAGVARGRSRSLICRVVGGQAIINSALVLTVTVYVPGAA